MGFGWFPSFIYQAGGPLEPMREGSLRPLLVPLDYFYKDILTPWVLTILLYILARAYYFFARSVLLVVIHSTIFARVSFRTLFG